MAVIIIHRLLLLHNCHKFRGRRRKNDLAFVETKTFDNHYKSLNAYLGQFKNLTEQNKKEFLINSAHNSCGDFKETVVKLCENFPNSTYLEIVTKLKKIYVIEAAKSLQFAANKVLNTTLSDDKTLGSQIVDVGASIEAVTNFLFKNEDSLIDKFEHDYEGYDDDDDDDEDDDERKKKVGDQPPRGAGGNAGVSTPERLMGHQPATEDPGSRRETRRPVETTAGTVGSGISRPVTHLKQNIGQCPSGKRTSVRCCVPGAGSRRGGELLTGADCPYLDLDLEGSQKILQKTGAQRNVRLCLRPIL